MQDQTVGSYLALGNELPEETLELTKHEILLEREPKGRAVG